MKNKISRRNAFSFIEVAVIVLAMALLTLGAFQAVKIMNKAKLSSARNITEGSGITLIKDLSGWYDTVSANSFKEAETANAAQVSQWSGIDKSSMESANDAATVQTNAANQPTYTTATFGLPTLSFDGNDAINLSNSSAISGNSAYTIFLVVNVPSSGGGKALTFGSAPNTNIISFDSNANLTVDGGAGKGGSFTVTTNGNNKYEVITISYDGTISNTSSNKVWVNSVSRTIGGISGGGSVRTISPSVMIVGDTSNGFVGKIGEIITFSRDLSNEERIEIEKYLLKKWGVKATETLATGNGSVVCTVSAPGSEYSPATSQSVVLGGENPYSCASGYAGTPTYSCVTSGSTISVSGCSLNSCTVSAPGAGYSPSTSQIVTASGLNPYTCAEGYTGTPTYSCVTNGSTITVSGCTANSCTVSAPGAGYSPSNSQTVTVGVANPYSCASGYSGTPTYSCTTNGATITVSGCTLNSCTVSAPDAAYSPPTSQTVTSTGANPYSCASGYSGTPTYSCDTNGATITVSGCTANSCTVSAPGAGYTPSNSQTVTVGGENPYSCASGYSGTPTYSCTTNGATITVSGCTANSCTTPSTPSHGSLSFPSGHNPAQEGEQINMSCSSGYTLQGNSSATCSNGSWDQSLGVCGPAIVASGGTVTYLCGGSVQSSPCSSGSGYVIHTFNNPGSYTITFPSTSVGKMISFALVAGGGGGGGNSGGGGGGGGADTGSSASVMSARTCNITIGVGGAGGSSSCGSKGANGGQTSLTSCFLTQTLNGGAGGGGGCDSSTYPGSAGGTRSSGGGGSNTGSGGSAATMSGYGSKGGNGSATSGVRGGGGGGNNGNGANASSSSGGNGGSGTSSNTGGVNVYYGAGGGGGSSDTPGNGGNSCGGNGGGAGVGGSNALSSNGCRGGGGGGGGSGAAGGSGADGSMVIRYAYP